MNSVQMLFQIFSYFFIFAVTAKELSSNENGLNGLSKVEVGPIGADGKRILGWVDRCVTACEERSLTDCRPAFLGRYPKHSLCDANCLCVSFVPESQDPNYELCDDYKCEPFCNCDLAPRYPIDSLGYPTCYAGGKCFSFPDGFDFGNDKRRSSFHKKKRCGCGVFADWYPLQRLPSDDLVSS